MHLLQDFSGQRAGGGSGDIFLQVLQAGGADNDGVVLSVGQCAAENELGAGGFGGQQIVKLCLLPDVVQLWSLNFGIWSSLGNSAADDGTAALCRCCCDALGVLWSEARPGDLYGVKDAQLQQCGQLGQGTGNSEPANSTLLPECVQQIDQSGLLQCVGVTAVKLENVDAVGLQSPQAGFEIVANDLGVPGMPDFEVVGVLNRVAAAFGGEQELAAAMFEVPADPFFGQSVVGCGVQQADAGIQHGMQDLFGLGLWNDSHAPRLRSAQSHAAKSQTRDGCECFTEQCCLHLGIPWG